MKCICRIEVDKLKKALVPAQKTVLSITIPDVSAIENLSEGTSETASESVAVNASETVTAVAVADLSASQAATVSAATQLAATADTQATLQAELGVDLTSSSAPKALGGIIHAAEVSGLLSVLEVIANFKGLDALLSAATNLGSYIQKEIEKKNARDSSNHERDPDKEDKGSKEKQTREQTPQPASGEELEKLRDDELPGMIGDSVRKLNNYVKENPGISKTSIADSIIKELGDSLLIGLDDLDLEKIVAEAIASVERDFAAQLVDDGDDVSSTPDVSYLLFSTRGFADFTQFVAELKNIESYPVSELLYNRLERATKDLLSNYNGTQEPSEVLKGAIVNDLNKAIQGTSIYDSNRFETVDLSARTKQLINANPEGISLIRLNRSLIEDAYPGSVKAAPPSETKLPSRDLVFSAKDFTNFTLFLNSLKNLEGHPLSPLLYELLTQTTQTLLNDYDGASEPSNLLKNAIIDGINTIIQGTSIYDEAHFSTVNLSSKTRKFIAMEPTGRNLVRLNRLLIEDAYPGSMVQLPPEKGTSTEGETDFPDLLETVKNFVEHDLSRRATWDQKQKAQESLKKLEELEKLKEEKIQEYLQKQKENQEKNKEGEDKSEASNADEPKKAAPKNLLKEADGTAKDSVAASVLASNAALRSFNAVGAASQDPQLCTRLSQESTDLLKELSDSSIRSSLKASDAMTNALKAANDVAKHLKAGDFAKAQEALELAKKYSAEATEAKTKAQQTEAEITTLAKKAIKEAEEDKPDDGSSSQDEFVSEEENQRAVNESVDSADRAFTKANGYSISSPTGLSLAARSVTAININGPALATACSSVSTDMLLKAMANLAIFLSLKDLFGDNLLGSTGGSSIGAMLGAAASSATSAAAGASASAGIGASAGLSLGASASAGASAGAGASPSASASAGLTASATASINSLSGLLANSPPSPLAILLLITIVKMLKGLGHSVYGDTKTCPLSVQAIAGNNPNKYYDNFLKALGGLSGFEDLAKASALVNNKAGGKDGKSTDKDKGANQQKSTDDDKGKKNSDSDDESESKTTEENNGDSDDLNTENQRLDSGDGSDSNDDSLASDSNLLAANASSSLGDLLQTGSWFQQARRKLLTSELESTVATQDLGDLDSSGLKPDNEASESSNLSSDELPATANSSKSQNEEALQNSTSPSSYDTQSTNNDSVDSGNLSDKEATEEDKNNESISGDVAAGVAVGAAGAVGVAALAAMAMKGRGSRNTSGSNSDDAGSNNPSAGSGNNETDNHGGVNDSEGSNSSASSGSTGLRTLSRASGLVTGISTSGKNDDETPWHLSAKHHSPSQDVSGGTYSTSDAENVIHEQESLEEDEANLAETEGSKAWHQHAKHDSTTEYKPERIDDWIEGLKDTGETLLEENE